MDSLKWDGFLSYSSADRRVAKRIQRSLQRYRHPERKRHLRIFLDVTDIRSGELSSSLAAELETTNKLIVCASPASADSRWVDKEFAIFRRARGDDKIGIVLLGGQPEHVVPPAADGGTYRWHDLRRRRLRLPFRGRRLEMSRLLAFVADVELRRIINWKRRRLALQIAIALPLIAIVVAVIALFPVAAWEPMELGQSPVSGRPIRPIACEIREDGKLWSAGRVRAAYALYPRNYIVQFRDSLAMRPEKEDTWVNEPVAPYRLSR